MFWTNRLIAQCKLNDIALGGCLFKSVCLKERVKKRQVPERTVFISSYSGRNKSNAKPQYQVIFTSTGASLIIRASVSHRATLPLIFNADLESLKHRL